MRRRFFNIASAMSLGCAIAFAMLWILSLWYACSIHYQHDTWGDRMHCRTLSCVIVTVRGGFWFGMDQTQFDLNYTDQRSVMMDEPGAVQRFREEWHAPGSHWQLGGGPTIRQLGGPFGQFMWQQYGITTQGERGTTRNLIIPTSVPLAISLLLPGVWFWRFQQDRKRARLGLCPTCGYDLRASKDRCPECGTPIPVQTAGSGQA